MGFASASAGVLLTVTPLWRKKSNFNSLSDVCMTLIMHLLMPIFA